MSLTRLHMSHVKVLFRKASQKNVLYIPSPNTVVFQKMAAPPPPPGAPPPAGLAEPLASELAHRTGPPLFFDAAAATVAGAPLCVAVT